MDDGTSYTSDRFRQLSISTTVRSHGGTARTLPDEVKIIPDTSIVHYRYTPEADAELIVVRVS